MGNYQVVLLYPLIAKQQDVHVDDAGTPAPGHRAPAFRFDLLGCNQQVSRRAWPVHLNYLVQESRLVGDTPWRRVNDAALTQNPRAFLTQALTRRAEVAGTPAKIRSQAQVRNGQRIWSATRTTRVICRTSWTRTTSAPRRIAAVVVAAVPSIRSLTGRSSSLPMNDLREVPMRIG